MLHQYGGGDETIKVKTRYEVKLFEAVRRELEAAPCA
jgi:hypothetical protein